MVEQMTDEEYGAWLDAQERELQEELKEMRASHDSFEDYIAVLENYYICAMLNWESCLQEVEELRAYKAARESTPALTTQGDYADHTLPEERR